MFFFLSHYLTFNTLSQLNFSFPNNINTFIFFTFLINILPIKIFFFFHNIKYLFNFGVAQAIHYRQFLHKKQIFLKSFLVIIHQNFVKICSVQVPDPAVLFRANDWIRLFNFIFECKFPKLIAFATSFYQITLSKKIFLKLLISHFFIPQYLIPFIVKIWIAIRIRADLYDSTPFINNFKFFSHFLFFLLFLTWQIQMFFNKLL